MTLLVSLMLSFAPPVVDCPYQPVLLEKTQYFGTDFQCDEILMDQDLRDELRQRLEQKHVRRPGQYDVLFDECPKTLEPNETCFFHRTLSYKEARQHLFGSLHLSHEKMEIQDIYALRRFRQEDFGNQAGPQIFEIPFHEILNTEHTWPQSRFVRGNSQIEAMQKGDLHHLFPSANRLNSYRGNYAFGETNGDKIYYHTALGQFQSDCRRGSPLWSDPTTRTDIVFQPPIESRGNIARALFYFSVRYGLEIDPTEEYYLREWHSEDPTDAFEIDRNEAIYEIQYNRNPFIDFPNLVDRISDF